MSFYLYCCVVISFLLSRHNNLVFWLVINGSQVEPNDTKIPENKYKFYVTKVPWSVSHTTFGILVKERSIISICYTIVFFASPVSYLFSWKLFLDKTPYLCMRSVGSAWEYWTLSAGWSLGLPMMLLSSNVGILYVCVLLIIYNDVCILFCFCKRGFDKLEYSLSVPCVGCLYCKVTGRWRAFNFPTRVVSADLLCGSGVVRSWFGSEESAGPKAIIM